MDFAFSDMFWDTPTLNGHSSAPNGRNDSGPFSTALNFYLLKDLQGIHKKSLCYIWKAIEPLRIEVEIKVRGASESAGAELFWTYHNFSVAHLGPEIFEIRVSPVKKIFFLM